MSPATLPFHLARFRDARFRDCFGWVVSYIRRNQLPSAMTIPAQTAFYWPHACSAAVSFTFDDANKSQVEIGVPILDLHRIRGTFYVLPRALRPELEKWRSAFDAGHEIGNHTMTHPCHRTTRWTRHRPLERFTLERMEKRELLEANSKLSEMLGVKPETFAYPCGHTVVGPAGAPQRYSVLVERHFLVGRGYRSERPVDPATCDLAHVVAVSADDFDEQKALDLVEETKKSGGWLIFAAHHIGQRGPGTMDAGLLDRLCAMAADPANGIWADSVANIGRHIRKQRGLPASLPS